jgi:hypothetical protein
MKKLKESEEGKRLRAQMKELGISDNMIWDGKDITAKIANRAKQIKKDRIKIGKVKMIMESGIDRIAKGECLINGSSPMACMFCSFGHMTDCHYPMTCEEAKCSHYREQNADAPL